MVKVISLSENAYGILKAHKREGMSFSDVIIASLNANELKTETLSDLREFVRNLPASGKKSRASCQIDKIVYGV